MLLTNEPALLFQKYIFWRSVNESGHNSWLSDVHKYSQMIMRFKEKKKFEEKNLTSKPAYTFNEYMLIGFLFSLFIAIIWCDVPGILVFTSYSYFINNNNQLCLGVMCCSVCFLQGQGCCQTPGLPRAGVGPCEK